jgi:DMSO/TMAO reductase YedYZ molybdopterin-dependent catalytic subunit
MHDPHLSVAKTTRSHTDDLFSREEVQLANRNSGIPLEILRHDVTPVGMHYLLTHFDVPYVTDGENWKVTIGGRVERPLTLSLSDVRRLPQRTMRVTLECAGNGRTNMPRRWQSMPWTEGAVGTAEWKGTPLRNVLEAAGLEGDCVEVSFTGADRGFDRVEHAFARSLVKAHAMDEHVLLVHAMNGQPLLPQHGFPLRLVVPGWYGMASVKWLTHIEALTEPFRGYQQVGTYMYRTSPGDPGVPITAIRVKSLMAPPGIPDWYSRQRVVEAGTVEVVGRAWSGGGTPITRVEFSADGAWQEATLDPAPNSRYAWRGWRVAWQARPGQYVLMCRATDANGETQPLEPRWDNGGFGNNTVHRVTVTVR